MVVFSCIYHHGKVSWKFNKGPLPKYVFVFRTILLYIPIVYMKNYGTYRCEYEDLSNNYAFYDEGVLKYNPLQRRKPTASFRKQNDVLTQIYLKAIKEKNADSGYTSQDHGKINLLSN